MIQAFTHSQSCLFSKHFEVSIGGQTVEVLHTDVADFTNFIYDASQGPAIVTVRCLSAAIEGFQIRPCALGISGRIIDGALQFTLDSVQKLSIEIDGLPPLFIWANAPEVDKPSPDDPNVCYYSAGEVYDLGLFSMEAGQTLYIEGGAVVRGRCVVSHQDDITIRGHGILDGGCYLREDGHYLPSILLERCKQVLVRDITMIRPSGWMLVPGACEGVEVVNLKQIGEVVSSDGIDIVGSKHVHVHDCFLRNNDDCVVVKAFYLSKNNLTESHYDFRESPEDILIENCTLLNAESGNAMEIGHELSVDRVSDVTFRNIDVLNVHGYGAVFSLHNNDRAIIENIVFEQIRVEHCWDKFIDFRISKSRYSTDDQRGHIRNVTLRDVTWEQAEVNVGYTVSIIGGWGPENRIEDVRIENMRIKDRVVEHVDELEITTRYADAIRVV